LFTSVTTHYTQLLKTSVSQWSSIHFQSCPRLKAASDMSLCHYSCNFSAFAVMT